MLKDYGKLKDLFIAKFVQKATKFLLDTRFHERKMKKGESVESFLLDLQDIASKLGKPETETLSQFLRGLSSSLKTPVMTQSPETLQEAAQMAMVAESVQKEVELEETASLKALTTGLETLTDKIDAMQKRPSYFTPMMRQMPPRGRFATAALAPTDDRQQRSWRASHSSPDGGGRNYHGSADFNMQCWSCGEQGHRQRNCPTNQQASPQARANINSNIRCYGCNNVGHIRRNCPLQARHPF